MTEFAVEESDVTLRDGRTVHLRAMCPSDEAELLQAFERKGKQARYMRNMRFVREPNLERLRNAPRSMPDRGIGLVATVAAADGFNIVGSCVAMIECDGTTCEFAIHTAEAFGRSGLGAALTRRLIEAARARGWSRMEGFVLAENQPMLALARRLGFDVARDPDDAAVRVCRLPLRML
jgi:RimJ/RimL family protein N-acetyltransferase